MVGPRGVGLDAAAAAARTDQQRVRRLVVRQGVWLLAIGMAIGVPASIAAARLLGKLLYGIGPRDRAQERLVILIFIETL